MAIILKVVTVDFCGTTAPFGPGPPDFEVSRSHSDTPHSVGWLWTSDQFVAKTSTWKNVHYSQQTDFHAPGGIRTRNPSKRAAAKLPLRPHGNPCRKVECNVVPVNDMKSLNGTRTHNFGSRWWWLFNFTPRPLYPLRKISRYQLNRILGALQSRSARFWKECGQQGCDVNILAIVNGSCSNELLECVEWSVYSPTQFQVLHSSGCTVENPSISSTLNMGS